MTFRQRGPSMWTRIIEGKQSSLFPTYQDARISNIKNVKGIILNYFAFANPLNHCQIQDVANAFYRFYHVRRKA